jgi:DNA-binding transcriptional MerR regulator
LRYSFVKRIKWKNLNEWARGIITCTINERETMALQSLTNEQRDNVNQHVAKYKEKWVEHVLELKALGFHLPDDKSIEQLEDSMDTLERLAERAGNGYRLYLEKRIQRLGAI